MVDILEVVIGAIVTVATGVGVYVIQRAISNKRISEKDMFERWNRAFDRPAFKGPFTWDSSLDEFKQAISTTIGAIGSGTVSSEREAEAGLGRVYIKNKERRSKMEDIVAHLSYILISIKRHEDYLHKIGKAYYEEEERPKK